MARRTNSSAHMESTIKMTICQPNATDRKDMQPVMSALTAIHSEICRRLKSSIMTKTAAMASQMMNKCVCKKVLIPKIIALLKTDCNTLSELQFQNSLI